MPHLSNFLSLQPHVAQHTASFTVCKQPRKLSFDPKQIIAQAQQEICAQFSDVTNQCSMWHLEEIPCARDKLLPQHLTVTMALPHAHPTSHQRAST